MDQSAVIHLVRSCNKKRGTYLDYNDLEHNLTLNCESESYAISSKEQDVNEREINCTMGLKSMPENIE